MRRWKVKKSASGAWWAHEPTCVNITVVCLLLDRCMNCESFHKAYAYAEAMSGMDHKFPLLKVTGGVQ